MGRTRAEMKVQCDVCQRAEATILCCADEAALCAGCDAEIHAANKLAGKHQRVPLLRTSPSNPICDICQEKAGYFFCLEDRALLCRQCDVAVHTATPYVSAHQRFLVTGVRAALQQCGEGASSGDACSSRSGGGNQSLSPAASDASLATPTTGTAITTAGEDSGLVQDDGAGQELVVDGSQPPWGWDEVFVAGDGDFQQGCYWYPEFGPSR